MRVQIPTLKSDVLARPRCIWPPYVAMRRSLINYQRLVPNGICVEGMGPLQENFSYDFILMVLNQNHNPQTIHGLDRFSS